MCPICKLTTLPVTDPPTYFCPRCQQHRDRGKLIAAARAGAATEEEARTAEAAVVAQNPL